MFGFRILLERTWRGILSNALLMSVITRMVHNEEGILLKPLTMCWGIFVRMVEMDWSFLKLH